MQRYFIESTNEITFTDEQIHHISKVMRMNINEQFEIVFNNKCFLVEIISFNPFKVNIINEITSSPELNVDITLLYCLPKGDKLDLVIQKATEIGVKNIILVQSSRCVCKYKKEDYIKKITRLNKIILEASEQSHRFILPKIIDIIDFKGLKKYQFNHNFIAYENEKTTSLNSFTFKKNESIGILIGSEGGFSIQEVKYAEENNYKAISLGKRILRSETACIYALSVLSFLSEDL